MDSQDFMNMGDCETTEEEVGPESIIERSIFLPSFLSFVLPFFLSFLLKIIKQVQTL